MVYSAITRMLYSAVPPGSARSSWPPSVRTCSVRGSQLPSRGARPAAAFGRDPRLQRRQAAGVLQGGVGVPRWQRQAEPQQKFRTAALFLAARQVGFGLQHLYAPQVHTAGAQPRTGLPPGEGEVPQSGGTGQKCQHFVDHLVMRTLIKRASAAPACSDRSGAPAFRNTLATGAKKAHTPFGMTPKSFQMAFPCS